MMIRSKINLMHAGFVLIFSFLMGACSEDKVSKGSYAVENWHYADISSKLQHVMLTDVTFGNSMFMAVGWGGNILGSVDGKKWTRHNVEYPYIINGITFGKGTFVAVGDDPAGSGNVILISTDGVHWTSQTWNVSSFKLNNVKYCNGNFVAVGKDERLTFSGKDLILTSTDGLDWYQYLPWPRSFPLWSVTGDNGRFVAVGTEGKILTSIDGKIWTEQNSGIEDTLYDITFGNGKFVAVGENGTIITSTDMVNWTRQNSGTTDCLWGITYGNDRFVVVGEIPGLSIGRILTSKDGINWASSTQTGKKLRPLRKVTYGNGRFVAVGHNCVIISPRQP